MTSRSLIYTLLVCVGVSFLRLSSQACANPYTVKAGDSLSAIATAHQTTLSAVEAANPSITNPSKITVGQVICLPGSSPSTSSGGVYSGSGSATYYYDVKTMCPQDPNGYPENKGIPKCASNTPGPNQKSLKEVNSNNVVAMDNTVLSKDRAKYCGKEITIMHNGAKVNPPDGGSFYIWDGCAACIGGGRIDLSVSGARLVSSDACSRGVIPGVTWSVSDKQVKAFVA